MKVFRNRKLIVFTSILAVFLWSHWAYCSIEVTGNVIKVGAGVWQGSTRFMPVLVKTAAATAPLWVTPGIGWAGIATMGACLMGGWLLTKAMDAAYSAWVQPFLTGAGYRVNNGAYEKNTGTQNVAGYPGMETTVANHYPAYNPKSFKWYATNALAHAAYGNTPPNGWWESVYTTVISNTVWCGSDACVSDITRHNAHTGTCTVGIGNVTTYLFFVYPTGAGYITQDILWSSRTTAQAKTDLSTAFSTDPVTQAEKDLWEKVIEPELQQVKLANSDPAGMLTSPHPTSGKTFDDEMTEEVEANTPGLDGEPTNPEEPSPNNFDPSYSGGPAKTQAWPEVPGIGSQFTSFVDGLKATSLFGLPNNLGASISAGSPVVSFNAGVFGSQSYDFSSWAGTILNTIKGIFMVACSWVAIRVVAIKGGGG